MRFKLELDFKLTLNSLLMVVKTMNFPSKYFKRIRIHLVYIIIDDMY